MAMTGLRTVTSGLGIVDRAPPQYIAWRLPRLARPIARRNRGVAVEVAHWGYGAAGGAVYAGLPSAYRRRSWAGAAYGLLIWVAFEVDIAPALGLADARKRSVADRASIAADHFLYGLVVAEIRPSHKLQR